MESALAKRGRRLEDEFFARQDATLIARLRELERMEQTTQALAAASGIRNEAVLRKLAELGMRPETLSTLAVVPMVTVAWADGEVDESERRAVIEGARQSGAAHGYVDEALLESWLKTRPPDELREAWTHYIAGLREVMPEAECRAMRDALLARARAVAEAAGSFLGLTSGISSVEQAALDALAAAFTPRPPA